MKKVTGTLLLLSVLLVSSGCSPSYEFWKVEKFNMSETALAVGEEVQLIYYSRGPHDDQVGLGFYRHAIVISSISNDTINVLTFPTQEIETSDRSIKDYTYHNAPDMTGILQDFPGEIKDKLLSDSTPASWTQYDLVFRDPKFDYIADNNFQTIVGELRRIK